MSAVIKDDVEAVSEKEDTRVLCLMNRDMSHEARCLLPGRWEVAPPALRQGLLSASREDLFVSCPLTIGLPGQSSP